MLRFLRRPCFAFSQTVSLADSRVCEVPQVSDINSKQDLLNLKENFLRIKVPVSSFNRRIKTLQAEEELVNQVATVLAQRLDGNRSKSKQFVILDFPSSLTKDTPTVMDFYNKVLKDFGRRLLGNCGFGDIEYFEYFEYLGYFLGF